MVSATQILYIIHKCDSFEFSFLKINDSTHLFSRVEIRNSSWQTKWPLQSQNNCVCFHQSVFISIHHFTSTSWTCFNRTCFFLPKGKQSSESLRAGHALCDGVAGWWAGRGVLLSWVRSEGFSPSNKWRDHCQGGGSLRINSFFGKWNSGWKLASSENVNMFTVAADPDRYCFTADQNPDLNQSGSWKAVSLCDCPEAETQL